MPGSINPTLTHRQPVFGPLPIPAAVAAVPPVASILDVVSDITFWNTSFAFSLLLPIFLLGNLNQNVDGIYGQIAFLSNSIQQPLENIPGQTLLKSGILALLLLLHKD